MRLPHFSVSLHGLRAQVLLWIVLPVTLLMIVFSLTGVQSHQNSMRALAVEENSRLVQAYARVISAEIKHNRLLKSETQQPIEALNLPELLNIHHPNAITTIVLLDADGRILFGRGDVPQQANIMSWDGVSKALSRAVGALFTSDREHGDVVAYAPVPNTSWVLLVREPWHSITDPLIRFEQITPFILLTAVVVSLLILVFGLRYVVRPLRELGVRISRFGQGEYGALDTPIGGVKEIEDLRIALSEMARRVQNYQGALHNYLGAITKAQEEERARLARELHDETVQTLIALGHKAQVVQRSFTRDPQQTDSHVAELRQMIGDAIEEVRRFSRALRPVYLEELGLRSALEILARETGASFTQDGSPQCTTTEKELVLYRVAQEALHNALRHAQAEHISLSIFYTEREVMLCVRDDGIGFEVPNTYTTFTQQGHFGVMGMLERALLAKGSLVIHSSPGKGTSITITLPI